MIASLAQFGVEKKDTVTQTSSSASGKPVSTHQGGYRDAKQLEYDIRRYALRG